MSPDLSILHIDRNELKVIAATSQVGNNSETLVVTFVIRPLHKKDESGVPVGSHSVR